MAEGESATNADIIE